MCGLFGFIERKPGIIPANKKIHLTRTLAHKTEVRGKQSWGIYARQNDSAPGMIYKGIGTFRGCKRDKERGAYLGNASLIMGHTRYATHGSISFKNCHPFDNDNFILAHNGVLANIFDKMKAETKSTPKGETDSELFLHWIVSTGKTWEQALQVLEYYDAFTVYDKVSRDIIFLCLGRQISYIETPDFLIYGSEPLIVRSTYEMVFGGDIPIVQGTQSGLYRVNKNQGVHLIKARTYTVDSEYWRNRSLSGFDDLDDAYDWRNPKPDAKKDVVDLPDWNNPAKEWDVRTCRWINKKQNGNNTDGEWKRGRAWDGVLQKWVDTEPVKRAGFLPRIIDTKAIDKTNAEHDKSEYARQLALINASEAGQDDIEGTELDPDMPCPVDVYIKRGNGRGHA